MKYWLGTVKSSAGGVVDLPSDGAIGMGRL